MGLCVLLALIPSSLWLPFPHQLELLLNYLEELSQSHTVTSALQASWALVDLSISLQWHAKLHEAQVLTVIFVRVVSGSGRCSTEFLNM